MDTLSRERRSWNMSRIRSRDTKPEAAVRSLLHRMGFRFRVNSGNALPGKPDVVLPAHKTVVFVHGCFWHRHEGCQFAYKPKSRVEFWTEKFAGNVVRDARVVRKLRRQGWRVLTVWECEIRSSEKLRRRLARMLGRRER